MTKSLPYQDAHVAVVAREKGRLLVPDRGGGCDGWVGGWMSHVSNRRGMKCHAISHMFFMALHSICVISSGA